MLLVTILAWSAGDLLCALQTFAVTFASFCHIRTLTPVITLMMIKHPFYSHYANMCNFP